MPSQPAATQPAASTLRTGTLVLLGVVLTLVFMVLRFPYDRLAERVVRSVEAGSGVRIQLADASLGLVRWAPGVVAETVSLRMPSGTRLDFERAGLRPALSLSWLRLRPALATEIEGAGGQVRGTITFGEGGGFRGRLEEVVLEQLPPELLSGPLELQGQADFDADLVRGPDGLEGPVAFWAREGQLQHPAFPLPIPYDTLEGELELGGERLAAIERIEWTSPIASGRAHGTLGRAVQFSQAPLDLEIQLTVGDAIRGSLNAQGVSVGSDGQLRVRVLGTPSDPIVK